MGVKMAPSTSASMLSNDLVTPITPPEEPDGPPAREKRKRAGKPKVRTGCVTCKIRRIKCDEEKPACQRCISTGRTCDGYKTTTKPKATRRAGFAQLTTSSSTSLTMLRPLVTSFTGDEMERQYIHRFLPIAEDVVGIRHVHNAFFWGHVVPEYCFMSEGVKHACVALSSTYHNLQLTGFHPDASGPPTKTERYIIKQYNLAVNKMFEGLDTVPIFKRYGIIMICCVCFFYIEIMRNQWPTALMHLINGLRLMSNLPDEIEDIFKHPERWSQGNDNTHARAIYMVKLLCRWEVSAGFLATNLRPTLSLHAYETRKRSCLVPPKLQSLEKLQEIVDDLYQDVNAFIWICKQYNGDDSSWDHVAAQLQHDVLQQRLHQVGRLVEKARASYGNLQNTGKAPDFLTFQACLLQHRGASIALDFAPLPHKMRCSPPMEEVARFEEIMAISLTIKTALQTALGPGASPWFNVDFGVVSALYIAATNCQVAAMRCSMFSMIMEWPWRENLWDGPSLRQKLQKAEIATPAATPITNLAYRPLSP